MSESRKLAGVGGAAAAALVAGAEAADKRAATDPLKGVDAGERTKWFKEAPDRWKVVVTMEWGGDRSLASELETVIKDADSAQWPSLEKKLLGVLGNKDCTEVSAGWVCRMLRLIGSEACVEALKPMLTDPKRSDWARYALETIPGEKVDAALAGALGKLEGDAKTGLEGTIEARKQFKS